MPRLTFVGDEGTYTTDVSDEEFEQFPWYIDHDYLVEWVPGVYEFTGLGKVFFVAQSMKAKGMI